jgi:nuclear factor of activated T-cells 5
VTGKNLTPCSEMKKEGTDVILIDFEPDKGNVIVCDCVGILKERHSDIEGKMAKQKLRTNWKKKSTKCRMVFRTEVELSSGKTEILQVVSEPISCTQLPGTPEILKMSLNTCDPRGGEELWMIGKNFMKDSVVTFQDPDRTWVRSVHPNKEFFNATHLIVTVPPYFDQRLSQPLKVRSQSSSNCVFALRTVCWRLGVHLN